MPTRKIKASPVKVTGATPDGQQFESFLEEDFFVLLRFNREVEGWESYPVEIDWRDAQGKLRKYTPDVLVKHKPVEGKASYCVLCEIKPDLESHEDLPRRKLPRSEDEKENEMKWDAAQIYAARRGWVFRVFRESEIRTPYLRNAKFLLRFRERQCSMRGQQTLLDTLKMRGPMTLERWVSSLASNSHQRADYLPTCYRLIADGHVKVDMFQLLTLESICEYVA